MNRIGKIIHNWQEFLVWLPVLGFLVLAGYVLLGAIDRTIGTDMLAQLLQLPILAAYLATACAGAWLFKRTYLWDMRTDDEALLHESARHGDANARWLIVKDRVEWLVLICIFAGWLWVPR